jgi:hypothetical protein
MIITLPLKLKNYIIFFNNKEFRVLNIEIVRSIHAAKHRGKYIYIYIYICFSIRKLFMLATERSRT